MLLDGEVRREETSEEEEPAVKEEDALLLFHKRHRPRDRRGEGRATATRRGVVQYPAAGCEDYDDDGVHP